jgi:pimeloyl-ACP methyl ester carboxylesterase
MVTENIQNTTLTTPHGTIYIVHSGSKNGTPLLLIHGNSFCSSIWWPLLTSEKLCRNYHVIAFDLPGHGKSSNAPNPETSYTQPAYADAALRVLASFDQHYSSSSSLSSSSASTNAPAVVLGWSLGGHVALEMLAAQPQVVLGAMLVGTPPVGPGEVERGFAFGGDARQALAARDDLGEAEMDSFARNCAEAPYEEWMGETVRRTDQRARKIMFDAFLEGKCADQRKVVAESDALIAVVNGKEDPFIELEFINSLHYKRLWTGKCVELEGLKHAPFWAISNRESFIELLIKFIEDAKLPE